VPVGDLQRCRQRGASLTYQWQRNEVNLTGATAATYTLTAAAADSGARFRAVVSNGSGATHPVTRVSFAVLNNSGASQTFQLDDLSLTRN